MPEYTVTGMVGVRKSRPDSPTWVVCGAAEVPGTTAYFLIMESWGKQGHSKERTYLFDGMHLFPVERLYNSRCGYITSLQITMVTQLQAVRIGRDRRKKLSKMVMGWVERSKL